MRPLAGQHYISIFPASSTHLSAKPQEVNLHKCQTATVGSALAGADHRFRARNYVKVAARN